MTEYFQSQEESAGQAEDDDDEDDEDDDDPDYDPESQNDDPSAHAPHTQSLFGGGRRLGDTQTDSQPIPAASTSAKSKKATQQKKFATLEDFGASNDAGEGKDGDDDDNQNFFAGGEKSGLAVKNPDDLKKRILEKAMKSQKPRPDEPTRSHFTGAARTLGGDDTPSREIAAVESRESSRPQRVNRTLHFWNDGFSIDDGDLYTTDDPRNAEILNSIRQGRAPLHIMGVMPGQEVDVEIKQHQENYVRPPKKFVPFSGQGNRLGSPTPGLSSMPGSFVTKPAASAAPSPSTTSHQVNDNKPTLTLRISLSDGTRLTSRFNTDHTIGDVYAFVQRADSTGRAFVLQTTFPTKVLDDKQTILGEMADFKRGGVVVQKYI